MPGFEITNYTEWPITVSLEQVGPLYYDIVYPGQTFIRKTGAVWFTVKAQLSVDGKCAINWVDAVVPVADITISVLLAACTGGATAYAQSAVKGVSWVAAKAIAKEAAKAGFKAAAEEVATFGFESITGLPILGLPSIPGKGKLERLGFVRDSINLARSSIDYFGGGKDDYVVEDKGEYAGILGLRKYWVTGGPKVYLHEDTVEGRGLIFTTSPLQLTKSRPPARDLARDCLSITRKETGKNLIYLKGQWHEIEQNVLNVVRGSRWLGTIEMTKDEITAEIGEITQGIPISPNIKDGSFLKASTGYYLIYQGLILEVPQDLASQPIEVPDRLIECQSEIPNGIVVSQAKAKEVYFLSKGRLHEIGVRNDYKPAWIAIPG